jgi:hypothetical protein
LPFGALPIMRGAPPPPAANDRRPIWHARPTAMTSLAFEVTSKRRKGYPSETHVKRGLRFVHGDVELIEKLGRNDPCPCGLGKSFQALLPPFGPVSTAANGMITGETRR